VSTTPATVTIVGNGTRGSLVLEDATSVTASSSCALVGGGCICIGDIAGGVGGIPDSKVTAADVTALVSMLNLYGGTKASKVIPSSNTNFKLCADLGGGVGGIPDNQLTAADVTKMVSWLNLYGGTKAAKSITCPHTYN
jgi:hypothetical protein